ncbi:hypothetical protein K8089_08405 [Aequorivita sp. F47161]|uniref:Uncharacterized protein n=2 Tax=Aequorivita vitellina TaxID=2874475 RepID=A0A9X1U395_9FLAO|nr:hypothetical protein [Aequorivita vitellina]
MDKTGCEKQIIDNRFSFRPLGKLKFLKETLTDTIFKNTFYENCESGHQNGDKIYSLSFYTDGILNKYTFVKLFKEDIYVLSQAEIQSNNTPLKVKTEKGIIGIGYSKASIAKAFNIVPKICDTLEISDEDGGSNHWLFFENDLLKKIVLINNIN